MNKKSTFSRVTYIIVVIILCIILFFTVKYYESHNFNNFIKSEENISSSKFEKDNTIKHSKQASYKIISDDFNDAMFYEKIHVEKNQPYKVTCYVKTENVEPEEEKSNIGAQISIEGGTERSVAVQGDSDWQKIEMIFNSKNRETINLGFRLGGNAGKAKGTAWFSDFTFEKGTEPSNDNNWKFACFIFQNTDVNINDKEIKLNVKNSEIENITSTISRFEDSCYDLSEEKFKASCDVYKVNTPITELSYDDEFGYFVSPENVEKQIKDTIAENDYDHIFVIVKLRR